MEDYLGQLQDLALGQDFLTWLWYSSERTNGLFSDRNGRDFALYMEQRVQVQGGEGESLETATVSGAMSELREARLGLATGKKVSRALIRVERDVDSWQLTLKAEDFGLNSLKTPKVDAPKDDESQEAAFLERVYLMQQCLVMLDSLYAEFLRKRLGSAWEEELRDMRVWIQKGVQ